MKPSPDSKWICAEDAASHLGVSLDTFYRLAASGQVSCARVGQRKLRTTRALCDAYLERQLAPLQQIEGQQQHVSK